MTDVWAKAMNRISFLANRGADICHEWRDDGIGMATCSRCGYLPDVHLLRDLVLAHAKAKAKESPAPAVPASSPVCQLSPEDVEWVVNDSAELGVKIGDQFFFCYKGHSLVYKDGAHDDGRPMMWRPVFKREFGECIHPINYRDLTKIGTVSLDDSDEWKPLPTPPAEGT